MTILYSDDNIIVLDKAAGLAIHADGRSDGPFLTDWLLENYPELEDVGEPFKLHDGTEIKRPGIVHRLDKDTSGAMVVARNQEAHQFLKEQFQEHTVKKEYRALVYGNFQKDGGVVDRPIGKSPKDYRRRDATSAARGELREAYTEYEVLERFISDDHQNDYSWLAIVPKTGRTHQIRVHMKAISHPVVGDFLYAPGKPSPEGLNRQALHAFSLEIELPNGERKAFEAPLPEDISGVLERLRGM